MTLASRNDLTIYERHGDAWWRDDDRTFRSLRAISEFRLAWLLQHSPVPAHGARVADIGCGGGLMALPLAARGARVIGVDRSQRSLRAAQARRAHGTLFVHADLHRCPLADGCIDVALLADVLEHVDDWASAVHEAARLLRPGGVLYVNTINKTLRARLLAVSLAEGLGLVPRGTHDAAMFVRPQDLCATAARAGLRRLELAGEAPRLVATLRTRAIQMRASRSLALAYAALFVKERS